MLNPSDRLLIQSCLGGDRQAWDTLILRYERLIYSVAVRAGLSEEDCADVFQDVCVILMKSLTRLADDVNLGGWLTTTTRWECTRMLRMRSRTSSFSEVANGDGESPTDQVASSEPLPIESLLDLEREMAVESAMEEMNESCRRLLTLLYRTEPRPTYAEIAAQLDIAEGAVGAKRARCLITLRKILERKGY